MENSQDRGRHRTQETEDPTERRGEKLLEQKETTGGQSSGSSRKVKAQEGGLGLVGYLLQGVRQISNRCKENQAKTMTQWTTLEKVNETDCISVQYVVQQVTIGTYKQYWCWGLPGGS